MVPGTFWYDFSTGPALGGIGALCAALVIGCATLTVSRHRRDDASQDRSSERERASREEWFRRLQWAQELAGSGDSDIQVVGFEVMKHLGGSDLASADDVGLLLRLSRIGELAVAESTSPSTVEKNRYILDDSPSGQGAQTS